MTALPMKKITKDNVIKLRIVDGIIEKKSSVKYKKDGSVDKRYNNTRLGKSCEVYPFTSHEEIKLMIDLFNKRIEESSTDSKRQIACRNKMLFLIGINLGIRASDLCCLRYSFFMNDDGSFKEFNKLQPKKTKKTKKYVKLYFNQIIKKAISDYVSEYPINDIEDYLFKSQKGCGHITEIPLGNIIKEAAEEIGIERNINSHSLRKTFGYWAWHNAKDKNKELITLQQIFNHSSPAITSRYIGITDDEMSDVFNNLDFGIDYL